MCGHFNSEANLLQARVPAGVVTDVQVGLPNGWAERDRARTTTGLIPVNAERLSGSGAPGEATRAERFPS